MSHRSRHCQEGAAAVLAHERAFDGDIPRRTRDTERLERRFKIDIRPARPLVDDGQPAAAVFEDSRADLAEFDAIPVPFGPAVRTREVLDDMLVGRLDADSCDIAC